MKRLDVLDNFQNFHFIGIGGVSMSGLAEILHNDGYFVTGSDQSDSETISSLRKKGINIKVGHDAQNVGDNIQVVVYNAAIPGNNPEMLAAKAKNLRLMYRAELLGRLMKNYDTAICVAGTHGKTTTTSMLAEIFMVADKDPTVMNGGVLPSMGGAVRLGAHDVMIAEACEYHDSFLHFSPNIGIILNIEMDHSDYFADIHALRKSFAKFAQKIPHDGLLVINSDILLEGFDCSVCTFGQHGHVFVQNVQIDKQGHSNFDVYNKTDKLGKISLQVPGDHNIQNAIAAISCALHCEIDFADIVAALSRFTGAQRRFQRIGHCNGAIVIDDYAHHPTEVAATINAAKNMPHRRLWVVFQPHTHARTYQFLDEFAKSLAAADEIIILDIYKPIGRGEGQLIHAKDLANKIKNANCRYLTSFDACSDFLKKHIAQDDLVITMGAGDINKLATSLVNMP